MFYGCGKKGPHFHWKPHSEIVSVAKWHEIVWIMKRSDPIEMHVAARPQKPFAKWTWFAFEWCAAVMRNPILPYFFPLCRIRSKKKIATSTLKMGISHEKNSAKCLKCGNKQNQRENAVVLLKMLVQKPTEWNNCESMLISCVAGCSQNWFPNGAANIMYLVLRYAQQFAFN